MSVRSKLFFAAVAFCVAAGAYVAPAEAGGKWHRQWAFHNDHGGHGGHNGNGGAPGGGGSWTGSPHGGGTWTGGGSKGAPGPIAGAGLPFLLLAGGYALVRRYRRRNGGDPSTPQRRS